MARTPATLVGLLAMITLILSGMGGAFAQASTSMQPAPFRVAVIGSENSRDNVAHLTELLMHEGYPYDYLNVGTSMPDLSQYSLVIIYQEGMLRLTAVSMTVNSTIEGYPGSLVWIGPGIGSLGASASNIFGVRPIAEDLAGNLDLAFASSGSTKTMIQNETVTHVTLSGAIVDGYFTDNASNILFPAETHLKRASGSFAYYFAYDVSDWWKADPNLPWSRPAILASAIKASLSYLPNVLVRAYPMNMNTMFIERIEDVDALHNSPEWVNRAQEFLVDFTANKIPLTVALIPLYVNPGAKLTISIGADSAQPVREWLWAVAESGGTVIQHGDTHQWGPFNSGAATEFLVNGTWMSYGDQLSRIEQGREVLEESLPIKIVAFEPPHYKADSDTINALAKLGYKYYFDDPNSPFFSFRYGNGSDSPLVVFPETLSYVPLNATVDFENWTKASIDELLAFNGILLQYDHLYDESGYNVGLNTMNYVLQKAHAWTPTIDAAGRFELDRAKAYAGFKVVVGSEVTVNLGGMTENGLTLTVDGSQRIRWVQVDGKQWSLFGPNYIILPTLSGATNTITIGFDQTGSNQFSPVQLGIIVATVSTAAAFLVARKIFGEV